MLDSLTRDTFAAHLNSTFVIPAGTPDGPATAVTLELVEATEGRYHAPEKGRESFSLMFRGPRATPLEQGTFTLKHDALGTLELFMVPIGEDAAGRYYQCVFNRIAHA